MPWFCLNVAIAQPASQVNQPLQPRPVHEPDDGKHQRGWGSDLGRIKLVAANSRVRARELAVGIGRRARHVTASDAFDVIAVYACYNDGSGRDRQRHTSRFKSRARIFRERAASSRGWPRAMKSVIHRSFADHAPEWPGHAGGRHQRPDFPDTASDRLLLDVLHAERPYLSELQIVQAFDERH
jgi:hypothetical protein